MMSMQVLTESTHLWLISVENLCYSVSWTNLLALRFLETCSDLNHILNVKAKRVASNWKGKERTSRYIELTTPTNNY